MKVTDLIKYLRSNVSIQNGEVSDQAYLNMTDEDIELYLEVARTRDFAKYPALDLLPTECIYPLMLLAKKELYYALASSSAPFYSLTADNNNQLKRGERFEHYMKLIAMVNTEYSQYLEDGGAGTHNTLTSFDVTISDRYYTKRNYELGVVPALTLLVDDFTDTYVEISWEPEVKRFSNYRVYVSENPILDTYSAKKVKDGAKLLDTIKDPKRTMYRVDGLMPNTTYYILVSVQDRTTLTGYKEVTVTTLP